MAKKFSKSIGYTGPITSTSINRSQAAGSPVGGYGKCSPAMKGAAANRVAPEAGTGFNAGAAGSASSVGAGGGKSRP
jgi:hypothetical protein